MDNISFFNAIDRIARNDYVPTAYEIELMNQLELERERVYVKNFIFAKPWPLKRALDFRFLHSDIANKFVFVIDPSAYDEMIEHGVEDEHARGASGVTSWLAADKDFERLSHLDGDDVQLIILILCLSQSFKLKLTSKPFGNYCPDYVGDGTPTSVINFLEDQIRARWSSSRTTISTWVWEEGDDQGLHLVANKIMRQLELHHAFTNVYSQSGA